jgi:serine/threonine protein kinase
VIELSRYVFETLREDEEFVLERGQGDGDLSGILVVAPVSKHPVPGILERLEHEYALRNELNSDWAARPLALVRHEGRPMLILEDPGGEPLDRLLGQPMELSRFLRTGFGIASGLPRERQPAKPPEMIAGTLAYMAPEQTGRMNRSIDSRSDLYSLGVTFYEMLTGVLPFTASDPMEWVHCHIARQPVAPDQYAKEIPAPLSAIVMKLLAKTAEDEQDAGDGTYGQRNAPANGHKDHHVRSKGEGAAHGKVDFARDHQHDFGHCD